MKIKGATPEHSTSSSDIPLTTKAYLISTKNNINAPASNLAGAFSVVLTQIDMVN